MQSMPLVTLTGSMAVWEGKAVGDLVAELGRGAFTKSVTLLTLEAVELVLADAC